MERGDIPNDFFNLPLEKQFEILQRLDMESLRRFSETSHAAQDVVENFVRPMLDDRVLIDGQEIPEDPVGRIGIGTGIRAVVVRGTGVESGLEDDTGRRAQLFTENLRDLQLRERQELWRAIRPGSEALIFLPRTVRIRMLDTIAVLKSWLLAEMLSGGAKYEELQNIQDPEARANSLIFPELHMFGPDMLEIQGWKDKLLRDYLIGAIIAPEFVPGVVNL